MGEKRAYRKKKQLARHRMEILHATVDLFYQKGFKGVTVPEIATAVDFGMGTLYRIFPGGKEEIYQSMQEIVVAAFEREVEAALAEACDERQVIRRYILAAAAVYKAYPKQMAMYVRDTAGIGLDLGSGLCAPLARRYRACASPVEKAIASGTKKGLFFPFPNGTVLRCLRSVINGFLMDLQENEMTIEQRAELIETFFFNGLLMK